MPGRCFTISVACVAARRLMQRGRLRRAVWYRDAVPYTRATINRRYATRCVWASVTGHEWPAYHHTVAPRPRNLHRPWRFRSTSIRHPMSVHPTCRIHHVTPYRDSARIAHVDLDSNGRWHLALAGSGTPVSVECRRTRQDHPRDAHEDDQSGCCHHHDAQARWGFRCQATSRAENARI